MNCGSEYRTHYHRRPATYGLSRLKWVEISAPSMPPGESKGRQERLMAQKIVFITGGNRGLGFQTALELKDADRKIVIGRSEEHTSEQAVAKLRAAGVDADVLRFDITNPADYRAAYEYFNSKYGRLDILVNNAGIAGGTFPGEGPEHTVSAVPLDLLHKVFETNFFAQVALTDALLRLIEKSAALATLPNDGLGGGYFPLGQPLP